MDRYEVIVVIAVQNGVRDIASPRSYEQLAQAEAELARLTAALQSGDWREGPWLSVFDGGKPVSMRSAASTSSTRPCRGSIERKSRRSVSRASSAIWPAISTPVGPAPTTTNVSHASRASALGSASAASKAARRRLRTASALSSDLTSAAYVRHSPWPKYE